MTGIHIDPKRPSRLPEETGENLVGIAGFILAIVAVLAMGGSFAIFVARGTVVDRGTPVLAAIAIIGSAANAFAGVVCLLGLCYTPRALAFAGLVLAMLGGVLTWMMFGR